MIQDRVAELIEVAENNQVEISIIIIVAPGELTSRAAIRGKLRTKRSGSIRIDAAEPPTAAAADTRKRDIKVAVVVVVAPQRFSQRDIRQAGLSRAERASSIPVNARDRGTACNLVIASRQQVEIAVVV